MICLRSWICWGDGDLVNLLSMLSCTLSGRDGEQRAHVLRFTRADVFLARCLGLRDSDGWRTRRCSMRELALRPCAHYSPP